MIRSDEIKTVYDNELGTQIFSNFVFAHLYTPDLPLNLKAHQKIKEAAFKIVQDMYQQSYNCALDGLLYFRDTDETEVALPGDKCTHYLIADIKNVIGVIEHLKSQPKFQYNMFIFLPYIRQLRIINDLFANDYCCTAIVKFNANALAALCEEGDKYLHVIKLMKERMHLINVFTNPKIYQCNICQETSSEPHFLKPNECCGYSMCNLCYANLWKFCNMYPVCPVCKTSFKSSKKIVDRD
ncbi:exon-0 [Agrotis segetum nucleopolyhedrovirus A]|uniref:Exon-0 n=1 Tax=Agrotis segetum nuclear polyhedrosis virus TaxID=1962501 RepID=Q287C0_NPVAS|nr:exon-0 [Agrotis segetum nucleopolyhedrovirus A]AAZ38318.1 exon-0 [Agrotis segetum nucleopolyhedrovirus A]